MVEGVAFAQLGPWGLVAMFCGFIAIGWLVPRWLHSQRVGDKQEQIDYLRKSLEKRDEQVDRLVEQGEVTVRLLEELKAASSRRTLPGSPPREVQRS